MPHPGKWSFSAACAEAWASNGAFADVVEEFIAGTDPELASATELLLEAVCKYVVMLQTPCPSAPHTKH